MNFTFALAQFELFVLILIRLASFVFAAPFFNMANVPNRVKIGFSFCLAIMVYSLFPDMSVEYNGMIEYAIIVVQEVIVGILLGIVSSFCVQIIMFSGKIIDMDIGISMAQLLRSDNQNTGRNYGQFLLLYDDAAAYYIGNAPVSCFSDYRDLQGYSYWWCKIRCWYL